MVALVEVAEALSQAAGWTRPAETAESRLVFHLAGGLTWELFLPNERTVIFWTDLGACPEENPNGFVRRAAAMSAAAFASRRSVLSLKDGRFRLHRAADMADVSLTELPAICASFLNDCDWWRANWPSA